MAVGIADAEGLNAVSIRRVASELGVQPMSLYSHVAAKDDLVALMLNDVSRELLVPEPLPGHWRKALGCVARRAFDAYVRHPWTLQAVSQGTRAGPNLLRRAEQLASIINHSGLDPADGWTVASIVQEWAMGRAINVVKNREDAQLEEQLHRADPASFPSLAHLIEASDQSPGENGFARALEIVLDGIETRISPTPRQPDERRDNQ